MHPHLPNQTVLLPVQVDLGAHHSGYRKSRQGPSQLTKSEVPFACPSPVSSASVVRCFLGQQPKRIKSHHIHRVLFSCSSLPLLPLHPSSPVSPLTAREPAPSAGQGTRLYRTCSISKRTDRNRPSPAGQRTAIISREAGSQQPSPSSQKAAQARQGTSSCHLTVKSLARSLGLVSHTHTRQVFLGRVQEPRATAPARQAKPSTQPTTGRAKSFQYLDLRVREGRLGDFRQISISLCLCSASQSGPWRLLKHTHILFLTHTACRTLFCCNSTYLL